jgi:hypothetical protein
VDWSTVCFYCESVLQKRLQFHDRPAWISKIVWYSSQSCCSVCPYHQDLGSKLWGYWFHTKEERWYCKNSMCTWECSGSERSHWTKSKPVWTLPRYITQAVRSQCLMDFIQRSPHLSL